MILRQTAKIFALIFLLFACTYAQDSIYRLDSGTRIRVKMDVEINSAAAAKDDTFTVRTTEPLVNGGTVLVPAGTVIEGRVLEASPAESGGRPGKLRVRFEKIVLDGNVTRAIDATLLKELRSDSASRNPIIAIIGGAAAGALLGAVTKSSNGALIGAGIGAGVGTGIALGRKGKDVRIKTGEQFEIVLNRDVVLPVQDY